MGSWGQPCEVLEVEPEKLLRYTFAVGGRFTGISVIRSAMICSARVCGSGGDG
jgi:uncharacterized protein YndB with AHSA1/START domain